MLRVYNYDLLKKTSKFNLVRRGSALFTALVILATLSACSNSKANNNLKIREQTSNSQDSKIETAEESTTVYLAKKSPEIYHAISLSNGEKRVVLLSNEPHLYKSLYEKTDTKVYLSDDNGNRLSNNFDEINLLSNYRYSTDGGLLLGDFSKVETDKQYDFFVGTTLRKDSNDKTVGPTVTLLDKNGLEFCSFNGRLKMLIGNIVLIEDYFEGENRVVGAPDNYLYNYLTGKKSEKHDYILMFKYKNEQYQDEENADLIGVNFYYEKGSCLSKLLYSFYDRNLNVVVTANEDEIKDWYKSNNDLYTFYKNDYNDYFKSIYQNINNQEKSSSLILIKK
jgi:hypothetical protein